MDNDQIEQAYSLDDSQEELPPSEPVSWTASEYIAHEKSFVWYVVLFICTAIITAFVYLVTREVLTVVAITVVAISVSFFASRPPVSKKYVISRDGIMVDEKIYNYSDFKSFSVVEEGAINSIWFKPLGRFSTFLIIYYSPEDEDKIISMLNYYLPHEQRELDFIDRTMKRFRF
jgi:hypothetical protein